MHIGVIGFQGAVSEHLAALERTFSEMSIEGTAGIVRSPEDLDSCDALIIPGGESTTISRHMKRLGLTDEILKSAEEGVPIMGTCAGTVILSRELADTTDTDRVELLGLMDMRVRRNAFGRQRESFERELDIKDFDNPFRAVFIRAPVILETGPGVEVLAETEEGIVMARQENLLAVAFHPELTPDTRVHAMLLEIAGP